MVRCEQLKADSVDIPLKIYLDDDNIPVFHLHGYLYRFVTQMITTSLKGESLSPFLNGRMFVRRTYFGQFDEL